MSFFNVLITKLYHCKSVLNRFYIQKKILIYLCLALLSFSTIISSCLPLNQQTVVTASTEKNVVTTVTTTPTETVVTTDKASPKKSVVTSTPALGIGLNGIADWSTQLPFLDAFKSSRQWITQCVKIDPGCNGEWDTNEYNLLNLDKDGWVKSLPAPSETPKYTRVSTLLYREIPGHYPSGKYIVFYEGEGTISYGFDAQQDKAASTAGRDVINVNSKGGGGILITITSTDPKKTGNYIRNIRVVRAENLPLYTKGEIFNPTFINKIKNFRAFRFMDWMQTNGSKQKEWFSRPKTTAASYALKGVPVEVMIALANKANAEPWFNMPHMATDEYMAKFAQIVKKKLKSNLKAYVEFSNEVWNGQFPQADYALQQGQARWGKDKEHVQMQWYGMRTAQMCDIWKNTFGKQNKRVVCVMGTHTGWQGLENAALDCQSWVGEGNKPCYQHGIDAYAIAGYFGRDLGTPENSQKVESWLNDSDGGFGKAIQHLKTGKLLEKSQDSLVDNYNSFIYHAKVARKKGLKLVAYEGGQHIVGHSGVENNEKLTNFFIELNRHPAMYDLYSQLLNSWQKAGGGLFMHFVDISSPSKWGSWGALEYLEQKSSPKYKALIDFSQNHS
ncbi:MAG: cellulose-binding protein [Chlorogloeopsis fritschii C42_A2020_084]|nr:cellulose-binding protein [Chlorogloeopsis fritschii C42_A2020_084]